ncbi:hypothetical protein GCM10027056_10190 [Glaciibacter psychrotolerans]
MARAVRDHSNLAAIICHEGVQHTNTGEFDPPNIDHWYDSWGLRGRLSSLSEADRAVAPRIRSPTGFAPRTSARGRSHAGRKPPHRHTLTLTALVLGAFLLSVAA